MSRNSKPMNGKVPSMHCPTVAVLSVVMAIAVATLAVPARAEDAEYWPPHIIQDTWRTIGAVEASKYKSQNLNPDSRTVQYKATGSYLNYGKTVVHRPSERLSFDDSGIPMIFQGGKFAYNSVTVANFALAAHDRWLNGLEDSRLAFLGAAVKLGEMQSNDGSIPNNYPYRHYTSTQQYKPGWKDGMGPGIALSVYARAYHITRDEKWLKLGNSAVNFLNQPAPDGPLETLEDLHPSLKNYVFFSEYPAKPHVYTLNGNMFTLLGLYDWWTVTGSKQAERLFERGKSSLARALKYFDIGTFSAYDLSYLTYSRLPYLKPRLPHISAGYHNVHIYLLRALQSASPDEEFSKFERMWTAQTKN